MEQLEYILLVLRALWGLALYDATNALLGFSYIQRRLKRQCPVTKAVDPERRQAVCNAVLLATCFYWKPVLCLQRSVCAVRMLRKYGVAAKLVIGYRPAPFFSHAWVEVDGRVVNGSAAYQSRMRVLCTV
jgi:hypothetical protein